MQSIKNLAILAAATLAVAAMAAVTAIVAGWAATRPTPAPESVIPAAAAIAPPPARPLARPALPDKFWGPGGAKKFATDFAVGYTAAVVRRVPEGPHRDALLEASQQFLESGELLRFLSDELRNRPEVLAKARTVEEVPIQDWMDISLKAGRVVGQKAVRLAEVDQLLHQ